MDKTPEYIEMCSKAGEIQSQWQPQEGDYVSVNYQKWRGGHIETVLKDGLRDSLIVSRNWEEDDFLDRDISIFLPRQDQLQEMIGTFDNQIRLMLTCYGFDVMEEKLFIRPLDVSSMEQLWLALIMSQKFSKSWNAEKKEWEKAN